MCWSSKHVLCVCVAFCLFVKKKNKTLELCFKESSVSTKALHNSCGYALLHLTVTPQTIAHQASLSMGFSWQEYWSGLPFPPAGNLPDWGIELTSDSHLLHWQADSWLLCYLGIPLTRLLTLIIGIPDLFVLLLLVSLNWLKFLAIYSAPTW